MARLPGKRDAVGRGPSADKGEVEALAVEGDQEFSGGVVVDEQGDGGGFLGVVARQVLLHFEAAVHPGHGADEEEGGGAQPGGFEVDENHVFGDEFARIAQQGETGMQGSFTSDENLAERPAAGLGTLDLVDAGAHHVRRAALRVAFFGAVHGLFEDDGAAAGTAYLLARGRAPGQVTPVHDGRLVPSGRTPRFRGGWGAFRCAVVIAGWRRALCRGAVFAGSTAPQVFQAGAQVVGLVFLG